MCTPFATSLIGETNGAVQLVHTYLDILERCRTSGNGNFWKAYREMLGSDKQFSNNWSADSQLRIIGGPWSVNTNVSLREKIRKIFC